MELAYLDDVILDEVQPAAFELGFVDDGQPAALTAGISPRFVAFSLGSSAQAQLITHTAQMNLTKALVSG